MQRHIKYQGTAKVRLDEIGFNPPLPLNLDSKNVERLRRTFQDIGCCRFDTDNHVPGIVSQRSLIISLQRAGVSLESLRNAGEFPFLDFSAGQLQALHGRHRVHVASTVLPPNDRWWTVDIYLDDLDDALKTTLAEEYTDQRRVTDGEIYWKVRHYEQNQNECYRQKWLTRFSPKNLVAIKMLDKEKNRSLRLGFDALLPIRGLWRNGMRINIIPEIIAISCNEEVLSYLNHVKKFWSFSVGDDQATLNKIDEDTVELLQLLGPRVSPPDRKTVCDAISSGKAFSAFNDDERAVICSRIVKFDGLIPSLYTFFQDFKYLETCALCIKRLIPPPRNSIKQSMQAIFVASPETEEKSLIQTSEICFYEGRADSSERLDMAYRQIWLYAMRHYPLMPRDPARSLKSNRNRQKPDKHTIHDMAKLAHKLGFRSVQITELIKRSADYQLALDCLLQARPPDLFDYDPLTLHVFASEIVGCFSTAVPVESDGNAQLVDITATLRDRCGIPYTSTQKQDSRFLFIDFLHGNEVPGSQTVTTIYVRWYVYFAFFGRPSHKDSTHQAELRNDFGFQLPQSPISFPEETVHDAASPCDSFVSAIDTLA